MEFKKYRLGEIATFSQGKQVDVKEQYATKGKDMKKFTRIVDYTNASEPVRYVENYGDRYFASENDLVMIRYGSQTAGMAVMGKNGIIANNLFKINLNNDIVLNKYMYYYLSQKEIFSYLRSSQSSSTMPAISFSIMNSLEIDIPSIDYQKKAINILLKIEKKQELNNKINDNLYNQAVAIYKDRFQNTKQEICSIGDYLVPRRGKNLLSRDAILGDVPVIAGGLEPATYHNASNTKAPVITISASGANAGYINLWNVPVWSSDSSYIDNDITENVYFWYVTLKTRQKEIFDAQTGSAQPHIYPQHIAELPINKLENEDVFKYEKQVEPLFKMIGKNKEENKYLEQLRDTLLPKLMNGEIDLDKIEI